MCLILKDKGKIQNLGFKYSKRSLKMIMKVIFISASGLKKRGGGANYRGALNTENTVQTLRKVEIIHAFPQTHAH